MGSSSSFDLSSYLTSTLLQPRAPQVGVVNKIKLVGAFNEKTHANVVLLDLGVRDLEAANALARRQHASHGGARVLRVDREGGGRQHEHAAEPTQREHSLGICEEACRRLR